MLIAGDNLRALISQYHIVDDERAFDETSITLRLDRKVLFLEPEPNTALIYGDEIPTKFWREALIADSGLLLPPHASVLACSYETVRIPVGYIGFIQTKGSLARLFVTVQCSDAQVDPGFSGQVTFEICNLAQFPVVLFYGQKVAQLFLIKTSTKRVKPYQGRYQNAVGPTLQKPER